MGEIFEDKATLAEEIVLNTTCHEDFLFTISALPTKLFITPLWNRFCSLFSPLFLPMLPTLFSTTVFAIWLCFLTNNGLCWILVCYACLLVIPCLCVTRMANIITEPYTWVYRWLFFLHYPSGGDCKHSDSFWFIWLPIFDDAKRGKMCMTMIVLVGLT